jgi:hypothetical protein
MREHDNGVILIHPNLQGINFISTGRMQKSSKQENIPVR